MEARELQLITVEDILKNIAIVRGQVGDRGVLRALHFIRENERVRKEVEALEKTKWCLSSSWWWICRNYSSVCKKRYCYRVSENYG